MQRRESARNKVSPIGSPQSEKRMSIALFPGIKKPADGVLFYEKNKSKY
jgi:hypothetical protein